MILISYNSPQILFKAFQNKLYLSRSFFNGQSLIQDMNSKEKVLVLDGGTGREIKRRGLPFQQPEWSALVLKENPEALIDIHSDFVENGADIITTNTYAIAPFHITEEAFLRDGAKLIQLACQMALYTKKKFQNKQIKLALSVPPLFGSYRPDLFEENIEKAEAFYKFFMDSTLPFIDQIDLFLFETMSSPEEAKLMCSLMQDKTKNYMLSFSLDDNSCDLRKGSINQLGDLVKGFVHKPSHVMLNCCKPETISKSLPNLVSSLPVQVQVGAYANNFQEASKGANKSICEIRNDVSLQVYQEFCEDWIRKGASVVGGCCGIGPQYMEVIVKAFKKEQEKTTS